MMVSEIKLANAMGGKTARACDNCISKRARWYCPADDAFLCQGCDSSVHSAKPLALRHERVRLKTNASMKHPRKLSLLPPSWHRGFTKKARTTRRYNKKHAKPVDLVPEEVCSDDEENDEQLLYRVPILIDPFVQELCNDDTNSNDAVNITSPQNEKKGSQNYSCIITNSNQLHGSLPSELELEEFAADVESLLGKGLDDESFDIEGIGFSDCIDQREYSARGSCQMKVEEGKEMADHNNKYEIGREPFELTFDFDSSMACEDDYDNIQLGDIGDNCKAEDGSLSGKKILLRLDYEGVLTAWSDQKSPWITGERPELDPNNGCFWPVCNGSCGTVHWYGDIGKYGHRPSGISSDGGREARVSRYREKRRTRLFTKKIRYEVRKLNADKRPRMKGRFVKRPIFPPFHNSLNNV